MRLLGDNLANTIGNIAKKQDEFSITPIIYQGDWYEYAEPMEYVDAHTVGVVNTNVDLTDVFAIGDRLGISQGGTENFFFVTNRTANTLSIEGGDNYTFTSSVIDNFRFSKVTYPAGFPIMDSFVKNTLNLTPRITSTPPTYTYNYQRMNFWMVGNEVKVTCEFELVATGVGGGTDYFYADLPITRPDYTDLFFLDSRSMTLMDVSTNLTARPLTTYLHSGSQISLLSFDGGYSSASDLFIMAEFYGTGPGRLYRGYPRYTYLLN